MTGTYELRSNGERTVIFPPGYRREGSWMEALESFPHLLATTEASSWLSAKSLLAFDLTPLQARMLAGTATSYEVLGKTWGFEGAVARWAPSTRPSYDTAGEVARAWKEGAIVR